jgi:hypothetical protein
MGCIVVCAAFAEDGCVGLWEGRECRAYNYHVHLKDLVGYVGGVIVVVPRFCGESAIRSQKGAGRLTYTT